MRKILADTVDGPKWWIVVHALTVQDETKAGIAPIHALTFLAQFVVKNKRNMFTLSFALENKLVAIKFHFDSFRAAVSQVGDVVEDDMITRSFLNEQKVIAAFEAYLASIYSTLEIVAEINRSLNAKENLPKSFREQAHRYRIFSLRQKNWLKQFYDLRTELTHYSTALPTLEDGTIHLDFKGKRNRLFYKKGGNMSISIVEILNFYPELVFMLNRWAQVELKKVDPKVTIDVKDIIKKGADFKHYQLEASQILKKVKMKKKKIYRSLSL